MRDDLRALRGILNIEGDVAAGNRAAGLADVLVPAGVIGMHVRVDDVANRAGRQRANGRKNLVREWRVLRIDDEHAVLPDLHRDVAARADEHVDVALRRQQLDLDGVVEAFWGVCAGRAHGAPRPGLRGARRRTRGVGPRAQ